MGDTFFFFTHFAEARARRAPRSAGEVGSPCRGRIIRHSQALIRAQSPVSSRLTRRLLRFNRPWVRPRPPSPPSPRHLLLALVEGGEGALGMNSCPWAGPPSTGWSRTEPAFWKLLRLVMWTFLAVASLKLWTWGAWG